MKIIKRMLVLVVVLASCMAYPVKGQDLTFNQQNVTDLPDTLSLGNSFSLNWQIINNGNDSVSTANGIEVELLVSSDSVDGESFDIATKIPSNNIFPRDPSQFPLSEILDTSEYSEGSKEVCLVVTNKTGQNQGRDTFCQTVYFKEEALDIGVTEIILPDENNEVFRDSIVNADLVVENLGNNVVRETVNFPIRTVIQSPNNRFLDTFEEDQSFDERLAPGETDTVSAILYVSANTDTGTYDFDAETRLGNKPLSTDPNSTNDQATTEIDVKYRYNLKPIFTGLDDGDTVIRGSPFPYDIDLLNEGPGRVASLVIQTPDGEGNVPFVIEKSNYKTVNGDYQDQSEVNNLAVRETTLRPDSVFPFPSARNYGLPNRTSPNSNYDSIELCFYHQTAVPALSYISITRSITQPQGEGYARTLDTTCITIYVEDKTFDIGVSDINPVGGDVQADSVNPVEVTIENYSSEAISSSNAIPVSVFGVDNDLGLDPKTLELDEEIPANGTVTVTTNLDLREDEEGQQAVGMETQWDDLGIDNNSDNDTTVVDLTIDPPEGIAESNLVEETSIYPNPAKDNARLSYNLKSSSRVTVTLENVKGQQVRELQDGVQTRGSHNIDIDVGNLDAGTYFYRIRTEDGQQTGKVVVE